MDKWDNASVELLKLLDHQRIANHTMICYSHVYNKVKGKLFVVRLCFSFCFHFDLGNAQRKCSKKCYGKIKFQNGVEKHTKICINLIAETK